MSVTVKYEGRQYVWHKDNPGWFTASGRRVTSQWLKDRLYQAARELS